MQLCLKYARLAWVVAILLMAGGQIAHALQDASCSKEHASERSSSSLQDQPDCPAGHSCCKSHSHVIGALEEVSPYTFIVSASGTFIDCGARAAEGPVQDIEYPPQLS